MDKYNSIEHDFHKTPNMYPNLSANISNEQQLRLNKINEIKDYLLAEIFLTVAAISSVSIASFTTLIGAPAGIMEASCGLTFSITTGFVKKFLKTIRDKKKKTQ